MYPSQVVRLKAKSPGYQPRSNLMQIAFSILHVKNGTQQTRKTPENKINYLIRYFFSNQILPICLLTVFFYVGFLSSEGQLISKGLLKVFISTKKRTKIFLYVCTKGQIILKGNYGLFNSSKKRKKMSASVG